MNNGYFEHIPIIQYAAWSGEQIIYGNIVLFIEYHDLGLCKKQTKRKQQKQNKTTKHQTGEKITIFAGKIKCIF